MKMITILLMMIIGAMLLVGCTTLADEPGAVYIINNIGGNGSSSSSNITGMTLFYANVSGTTHTITNGSILNFTTGSATVQSNGTQNVNFTVSGTNTTLQLRRDDGYQFNASFFDQVGLTSVSWSDVLYKPILFLTDWANISNEPVINDTANLYLWASAMNNSNASDASRFSNLYLWANGINSSNSSLSTRIDLKKSYMNLTNTPTINYTIYDTDTFHIITTGYTMQQIGVNWTNMLTVRHEFGNTAAIKYNSTRFPVNLSNAVRFKLAKVQSTNGSATARMYLACNQAGDTAEGSLWLNFSATNGFLPVSAKTQWVNATDWLTISNNCRLSNGWLALYGELGDTAYDPSFTMIAVQIVFENNISIQI